MTAAAAEIRLSAQLLCTLSAQRQTFPLVFSFLNSAIVIRPWLFRVEEFLIEEGYFYLTASHRRKARPHEEYPRLLMERSVEGFIVIDTILEKSMSLPVVVVAGHRRIEGVTNVVLDQKRAAELALRHLYQLGHRKIAFMRGGSHSSDADDRWNCLMAVARDLKIASRPNFASSSSSTSHRRNSVLALPRTAESGSRFYRPGLSQ